MELKDVLVFLSTTGAAVLAYWLMNNITALQGLAPPTKRLAAFGLTALIAVGAWALQVLFLYQPSPADWRGWVEALSAVAFGSIGLNQIIHSQLALGTGAAPEPKPTPPSTK